MHCLKKIVSCLIICIATSPLFADQSIETYFNYTEQELSRISNAATENVLFIDELKKWDALAMRVVQEKKMNFYDYTRLFTYLYVAQFDFASLSQKLTGKISGTFDPLSQSVLSLFFGGIIVPQLFIDDAFSQALGQLVFKKVEERFLKENRSRSKFFVPQALQSSFSAGLQVHQWMPWFATPAADYWPPPPPPADSPVWKEQIKEIKQAQNPMTQEKKEVIYRWAGLAYPWSDDWRSCVNDALVCRHVPLQKMLQVRFLLMVGLYDCVAAYAGCKYHYLVIRPQAFDPSIQYEIQVPKHPSYPSGHSTESTVAALVMEFFFPEEGPYWKEQAAQCRISRIWAGIHYPIDDQGGQYCGKRVANKVIESFQHRSQN